MSLMEHPFVAERVPPRFIHVAANYKLEMEQKTMDALEAIQTRRSVRRYVTRQIDDEIVEQLLSAAMSAPSAANEQPWEFIVIKDREMLDGIPAFSPYARMTTHAPLGILVCADTVSYTHLRAHETRHDLV